MRNRLPARLAAILLALPPCLAAAGATPNLGGAFSLGYDSNPAQRRDGPALGFAQLALELRQPLPRGFSLESDVRLRDYAGPNDNGRLDLNAAWSHMFGTTSIELWSGGGWYRDQLVEADERDETALGLSLNRALTARFDLALMGQRRWLDYRHPVLPWAGRPGGVAASGHGQGLGACSEVAYRLGGPGARQGAKRRPFSQGGSAPGNLDNNNHPEPCPISARHRADRLDLLVGETTWLASPRLSLTLGLDRAWRESSIPLDAYDQRALRLALAFAPNARYSLNAEFGYARFDYAGAPQQRERIDHQRWGGIEVRQWRPSGYLFCGLDLLDSRSTLEAEAFTQLVASCGYQHDL